MAAGAKGLINLETRSAILHEQLFPRVIEGKREPCEITFNDFDDVSFKVSSAAETLNIIQINVAMRNVPALKSMGSEDLLNRLFPGMEVPAQKGFNYAIQFDLDSLSSPQEFLNSVCEIKRHLTGGPLDRAFTALQQKTSGNLPIMTVQYRKDGEAMFICPAASKVVVIFMVDFADITDKAVARVFLQEFLEAQRSVRTAPPVSYSKEVPGELAGLGLEVKPDIAGFLSFSVEERHLTGQSKEQAISLLTGFRNYLHYHIKCSKTYLHMRMRKRVAGWMQVLNRALPEIETEKKTAAGKTFSRK